MEADSREIQNYSDYLIFESMNEVGFDTLYNKIRRTHII